MTNAIVPIGPVGDALVAGSRAPENPCGTSPLPTQRWRLTETREAFGSGRGKRRGGARRTLPFASKDSSEVSRQWLAIEIGAKHSFAVRRLTVLSVGDPT